MVTNLNPITTTTGKFCRKPFEHLEIHPNGNVSLCCYSWLPYYAGQVNSDNSVHEVFNSEIVQDIRKSIHDGSFKYCNHKLCPHIQNGSLPVRDEVKGPRMQKIVKENIIDNLKPDFYNLCYDESCNLSCPSCRVNKINFTSGDKYEQRLKIQKQIIKEVFDEPHDRNCTVNITGSGDPFGSKLFRELLFNINGDKYPRVNINLQTNGVMFTPKYWNKMKRVQKNINTVIVSVDAGTPKTYKITRRGGNWKQLLENMIFLSQLRRKKEINGLRIDFVVQEANYKEMALAVIMGKKFNVDTVYFSKIVNWGTWTNEQFSQQEVHNKHHPEYDEFLNILTNPLLNDPIVDLGNLTQFRYVSL